MDQEKITKALAAMEYTKVTPSAGDTRVWWTSRRLGEKPVHSHYAAATPAIATLIIQVLASREVDDDRIEYNASGYEEWDAESNDWFEWYDGDGRDISEHFDD